MIYQKETTHIDTGGSKSIEYSFFDDSWHFYSLASQSWGYSILFNGARTESKRLMPLEEYIRLQGGTPTKLIEGSNTILEVVRDIDHKVLKYQIPILEDFKVELPEDIEILRVDNQDGFLYIWGKTRNNCDTKEFHFKASKTGGSMGDLTNYRYIGFASIYVQMELGLYYFVEK